jgi:hypothetical protein
MLQLLSLNEWFFIQLSTIHNNASLHIARIHNIPKVDEQLVSWDDNLCKLIHKKRQYKSYHNDIKYHRTLNKIFSVFVQNLDCEIMYMIWKLGISISHNCHIQFYIALSPFTPIRAFSNMRAVSHAYQGLWSWKSKRLWKSSKNHDVWNRNPLLGPQAYCKVKVDHVEGLQHMFGFGSAPW